MAIRRKSPAEAVSGFDSAERDLKFQRKLKIAENEAKLAKANLAASEAEVATLRKQIEVFSSLSERDKPAVWRSPVRKRDGSATAVFCFSDWHCEQGIRPERVSGLNEYSLDICEKRIKNAFSRCILLLEDARNLVPITEVVVWLGGDMIHGSLREEAIAENALHPMEACRWASDRIESGLSQVLSHNGVKRVLVVTNHGNHGRSSMKMPSSTAAQTSYENNMYHHLKRVMGKSADWSIADGYFNYVKIQNSVVRFHHGDKISFGGGINGVGVPAYRFISNANTKIRADLDVFGHFHTFCWPGCFVGNGSLVGVDEYSQAMNGDTEPKQAFLVIDKDRGLTRALPVFVN